MNPKQEAAQIDLSIARRVKKMRAVAGFTQEDLAGSRATPSTSPG